MIYKPSVVLSMMPCQLYVTIYMDRSIETLLFRTGWIGLTGSSSSEHTIMQLVFLRF